MNFHWFKSDADTERLWIFGNGVNIDAYVGKSAEIYIGPNLDHCIWDEHWAPEDDTPERREECKRKIEELISNAWVAPPAAIPVVQHGSFFLPDGKAGNPRGIATPAKGGDGRLYRSGEEYREYLRARAMQDVNAGKNPDPAPASNLYDKSRDAFLAAPLIAWIRDEMERASKEMDTALAPPKNTIEHDYHYGAYKALERLKAKIEEGM